MKMKIQFKKMIQINSLILFFILIKSFIIIGQQEKYALKIIIGEKRIIRKFNNVIQRESILSDYYYKFLKDGFLLTQINTIDSNTIEIIKGKKHKCIEIFENNNSKILKIPELSKWMQNKVRNDAEKGYPFSRVRLEFLDFNENETIRARLNYDRGVYLKISKIHIKGNQNPSLDLIQNLINIREGDVYIESKINSIDNQIKNCYYLQMIKPTELLFTDNGVEIFCYVQKINSSSANGILGIQPNSIAQKIGLTGEFNLNLLNVLQKGENFHLDWKSPLPQTSSLNCDVNYPYLVKSLFGLNGQLKLYKRDTTFLDVTSKMNVLFKLNTSINIGALFEFNSNNKFVNSNTDFVNNKDINSKYFGFNGSYDKLDDLINPSKGQKIYLEVLGGLRSVSQGNVKNNVVKIHFNFQNFFKLNNRNTILFQSNNQFYYADTIYSNERFRCGGINSIRGFNEETLFSTANSINTLEYRFRLDNNSYAFGFLDQGLFMDKTTSSQLTVPFGFGIGFAFKTNVGLFNIVGAYGFSENQPLKMNESKIHFGYSAFF